MTQTTDQAPFQRSFTKIDNVLFEYVNEGTLTVLDLAILALMHLQCDYTTGIWTGSAPKLEAALAGKHGEKVIQRSMRKLDSMGLITMHDIKGRRGNYPVVINNYTPTKGENKGKLLRQRAITIPSPCGDAETVHKKEAKKRPASPSAHRPVTVVSPSAETGIQDNQYIQDIKTVSIDSTSLVSPSGKTVIENTIGMDESRAAGVESPLKEMIRIPVNIDDWKMLRATSADYDIQGELECIPDEVMSVFQEWEKDWMNPPADMPDYNYPLESFLKSEIAERDWEFMEKCLNYGKTYLQWKIALLESLPQTEENTKRIEKLRLQCERWCVSDDEEIDAVESALGGDV